MLIDCHTHLDAFNDDEVPQIMERARLADVRCVVTAGTTLESSNRSIQLADRYTSLFSGVGVHPMDLSGPLDERSYSRLRTLATRCEKAIVLSETGLDFVDGAPDRAIQYQAFREQIRLARELRISIVFHSRCAHMETLRILREERAYEVGGAMHYFQADLKTARQAIDLGFHISLARPLLRLEPLQQVAAALSVEHIVLETDTAPQPFKARRDRWAEPRDVKTVAEKLAQLKRLPIEEVEEITTGNFLRMIGLKRDVVLKYLLGPE